MSMIEGCALSFARTAAGLGSRGGMSLTVNFARHDAPAPTVGLAPAEKVCVGVPRAECRQAKVPRPVCPQEVWRLAAIVTRSFGMWTSESGNVGGGAGGRT